MSKYTMSTICNFSSKRAFFSFCVALPTVAHANTAIPGTLIWFSGSMMSAHLGWISICMGVCILVEWAIYRYYGQYKRPLLASLFSNIVSLIIGIPLGLLAFFDPTWFVLPTIVSIFVEYWSIVAIKRLVLTDSKNKISLSPVFWGNIVSNLMILVLMYIAQLKVQYNMLLFW